VVGADDTVEQHSGRKITAKGCYRETVALIENACHSLFRPEMGVNDAVGSGAVGVARLRWEAARDHPQAHGSPASTVLNP
jgi:hypothetical protein